MIPDFEKIGTALDAWSQKREELILLSRKIVKESKLAIYSTHRSQLDKAEEHIKVMENLRVQMNTVVENTPKLMLSGSFKIAEQEYVEAKLYLEYVKNGALPSCYDLNCDEEFYLLGICDLTGELGRLAVNAVINKDRETAETIRKVVDELYGQLCQLDLQNGELRKKFDSIKYDLKKLEDLSLQLSLKHD